MSSIIRGNDNLDSSNLATDTELSTALAGKANTIVANDSQIKTALNASGTAPIYACRAWVNFNGTGTVAIRASGNVSSITDLGVGSYTVNCTIPMPDANYCVVFSGSNVWGVNNMCYSVATNGASEAIPTTTSISVTSINQNGVSGDSKYSMVSIFR